MTALAHHPLESLSQFSAATVVGLGVTGFSAVRYLHQRGLTVHVIDSRQQPSMLDPLNQQYPQVSTELGEFDKVTIAAYSLVVVSPGVALREPFLRAAKKQGCYIVSDIELFLLENTQPLIAITGSNGKSTVTILTGCMCKAGGLQPLVAGNIGLPVLDALTDQLDYNIAVLELSSFQLEATHRVPAEAATILNISADHLDRYASMDEYVLAKARIFNGAKRMVLPRHDEHCQSLGSFKQLSTFALDEPSNDDDFGLRQVQQQQWLVKGQKKLMKVSDIALTGSHNVSNVLAAFALVDFLELNIQHLNSAVAEFVGLPHRMQTVAHTGSVRWVNDSKATNIGATQTALTSLQQPIIWIAGGQGKGADFSELRDSLSEHIVLVILLGEDASKIADALADLVPIKHANNMHEAINIATQHTVQNCVVLLSPACASLDMYPSYAHRGDDFIAQVRRNTYEH